MTAITHNANCRGCKWLDEVRSQPPGTGYCSMVVRSKHDLTMDCVMDCGHRAPKIRAPELARCELYEPGDFKTRYNKE